MHETIQKVQLAERNGDFIGAIGLLDKLLLQYPDNPDLNYRSGILALQIDHQQLSNMRAAENYFSKAILLAPEMTEAHFHLGIAMQVQTRHVDALPHFLKASELDPKMDKAFYEIAKIYHRYDDLKKSEVALKKVLELNPEHHSAAQDLSDLTSLGKADRTRIKISRFPNQISEMQNFKETIYNHLLEDTYPKILDKNSNVVTFGSCFAGNIARALREKGISTQNITFGEFVNSTYANRHYIDWVIDNIETNVSRAISEYHSGDPNFPDNRAEHRRYIENSNLIVLTLGVAPCFFSRETNELIVPRPSEFSPIALLKKCVHRTTSVTENIDNLNHIIFTIRKINKTASIFLTVSPVPLVASFEYQSAVIADCVSKSTLRVAVDELMRSSTDGLFYWPSFEAIKWFGCYKSDLYGADDGSSIHVSEAAISVLMDCFISEISKDKI